MNFFYAWNRSKDFITHWILRFSLSIFGAISGLALITLSMTSWGYEVPQGPTAFFGGVFLTIGCAFCAYGVYVGEHCD